MSDRIERRLDNLGDSAFNSNPGGDILKKVGNGVFAVARTMGMAIATKEVAEETFHVGKDLFTGAAPTTWAGKLGENVIGGVGEFLALTGLAIATYNCGADTLLSAYKGYKQVVAS